MRIVNNVLERKPVTIEFTYEEAEFLYSIVGQMSNHTDLRLNDLLYNGLQAYYNFPTSLKKYDIERCIVKQIV